MFDIILGDSHDPMQILPPLIQWCITVMFFFFAALDSIVLFSSLNCHIIAHYQPSASSKLKGTSLSFPSWLALAFLPPVTLNSGQLSGQVLFKGCGLPLTKSEGKDYGGDHVFFYFVDKT